MALLIPNTATVTSFGLVLLANNINIGTITKWTRNQTREKQRVFEFGNSTIGPNDVAARSGEPYEIVPGNIGDTELTFDRLDLYTARIEQAFGTLIGGASNLTMLTDQTNSFNMQEIWRGPNQQLITTNIFYGCWITALTRTIEVEGGRAIRASGTVSYTRVREFTNNASASTQVQL